MIKAFLYHRIIYPLILFSDKQPTLTEKTTYGITVISTFAPIAFLLNGFNLWFESNAKFCQSATIIILINIGVGIWFHLHEKTFKWEEFFKRNTIMIVAITLVYIALEQFRLTIGENTAGEIAKVTIQCATLLWPLSKIAKNVYILTDKKHPPSFIMQRLYNFEKSGNIKDLLENEVPAENENIDPT